MVNKSLFGTDGIRGKAGSELTPIMAVSLGLSSGSILGKVGGKVIIGKDSRISGDMLSLALASGLMAVGLDVYDTGILPTPGVALLTREKKFDFGVVVSASHNPVEDNGFKFFDSDGFKLENKQESEIEFLLSKTELIDIKQGTLVGRRREFADAKEFYLRYLIDRYPINLDGLKVVVDTAYGATSVVAPELLSRLGAEIITIHGEPDGNYINVECGSTNPHKLQRIVKELKADIGIAYDGDGDRAIFIDQKGELVNGDQVLAILSSSFMKNKRLEVPIVVGTVLTNEGLNQYLTKLGGKLIRVDVGDKNISYELGKQNLILGGERSGHIIIRDRSPTGDGIITSLEILNLMKTDNVSLFDLKSAYEEFPQYEKNIPSKRKFELTNHPLLKEKVNSLNELYKYEGRAIVRASGTEPVIRIMVEFKDRNLAELIIKELVNLIYQIEEN